ncbi:hypothetical protein LSCM1_06407 [Leishmania martiniquensis]|uniref:Uncharacterized protein n=1 Tax=Leishmania martiniquensis TaxID=1580590 RepID=A0A836HEN6_9TRYP|nr:hypothetical protein LSCM1_06407 [Leishmania martiniquensis]
MERLSIIPTRAEHILHKRSGAAAPATSSVSPSHASAAHVATTVSTADPLQRRSDGNSDRAQVTAGDGATPRSVSPSEAAASPAPTSPFLRQRRLPSILLDSWEFRKLATEGSVLANAMVSYDVDDDGLEEVIVGTTEGLLCVVKPDCRAPLFMRALAATISVVLYTPIQSRLVLVTLEGQCEVTDHFLKPTQQQRTGSEPVNMNPTTSTEGADGGTAGAGGHLHQGSDSASSLPRTSSSRNGGARSVGGARGGGSVTPSSHSTGGPWSTESFIPTHVFHVPSNCLCADLSPDRDADLIFLGSYDRRLYVYSIVSGSCLLSLFVHDPITSVKAFAIPTSAADVPAATTSSPICAYDQRALTQVGRGGSTSGSRRTLSSSSAGTGAPGMLDDSPQEAETTPDRVTKTSASQYIPLVFISTPTHLILLPAGVSDIQQWRNMQPKSAHLPLTVQLRSDDSAPTLSQSQRHQLRHEHTRRRSSIGSGEAAKLRASSARSMTAGRGSHLREGEASVPSHMARAWMTSSPALRPSLIMSAGASVGACVEANASGGQDSTSTELLGGATTDSRSDRAGAHTGEGGHTLDASLPATTATTEVAPGLGTGSPLSGSRLRRQARRRAIQAAEMGRPVLVKPLWALRIGSHTLDVPLLQTMPCPEDSPVGDLASAAPAPAAVGGGLQSSSATEGAAQESAAGTALDHPPALRPYGGAQASVASASDFLSGATTTQPGADSSVFSVSSPSSVSVMHGGVATSHNTCSSDLARHDTLALSSLAGTAGVTLEHVCHHISGQSGDSREGREASQPSPALSAAVGAAERSVRRSTLRRSSDVLSPQMQRNSLKQCTDDDGQVADAQCSSSDDGDEETDLLGNVGALNFGGSVAPVRPENLLADREQKEDESGDSDNGTVVDEHIGNSKLGASTTTAYNSGSDACDRSSSGEVDVDVSTGGRRVLANSSTRGSRQHHQGAGTVESALVADSVPHLRAQSLPTTLLPRTRGLYGSDNGGGGDRGGSGLLRTASATTGAAHLSLEGLPELDSERHPRQHHRSATVRRQGERENDRLSRDPRRRRLGYRESRAQQHPSARGTSPFSAAATSVPDGADVRLPTSVDVSVGVSQVAVALSCEDGLALELRFSVLRLSALSRRERRLPRGTVRLYDMQCPPSSHASEIAGCGAIKNAGPGVKLLRSDGPAASPASPGSARCLHPRRSHGSELPRHRRTGASQATYIIYLPAPATALTGMAAAPPLQSHLSGAPPASMRHRQRSRSGRRGCGDIGGALVATAAMSTPVTVKVTSAVGSTLAADDTGCFASVAVEHCRKGAAGSSTGRDGHGASLQRHGEDTMVLRAQCLWAARLSDSPLVQRSRVFWVRDSHSQNTFCTVFVAANGTCFAVDGDALSLVKCCVKEDCSSFTLMAGPCSTMPMLSTRPSVATLRDSSADTSAFAQDGVPNGLSAGSSASTVTLNLLRGAVGRTVSCVCVSIDELCVYSVGEANQLCLQRDCATDVLVASGANEPLSLLSRGSPSNSYARGVKAAVAPAARSTQATDAKAASLSSSVDPEEQELLGQLAVRLRHYEQCASAPSHHGSAAGAGAASGSETAVEVDEEVLMRVKQMLLYAYSEREWEKLQSIAQSRA